MSNVGKTLRETAAELRLTPEAVAIGMLKEAGLSEEEARFQVAQELMEKEAVSSLTDRGIDIEEAVKLVKAANINVRELEHIRFEPESDSIVDTLEKAAEYIEKLEGYVAQLEVDNSSLSQDLEKAASQVSPVEVQLPGTLNKMASVGAFTSEDLEQLRSMNPELLTKVASAIEEPWGIGAPAGMPRPQTDPLLEFILS